MLTGVSIAAYSVADGIGGRLSHSALAYLAWMSLIWSMVMASIYVGVRDWRSLVVRPRRDLATAAAGGLIAIGGYGIIIWAMTVSPMGPVSALRETSVVFATLIARLFPVACRRLPCRGRGRHLLGVGLIVAQSSFCAGNRMLRFSP